MTETTLTPAPDDSIEYGYAGRGERSIRWTDDEGDLYVGSDYYPAVDPDERELATLQARVDALGGQLFERTVSRSAARLAAKPLPPLYTVALADVVSPIYGDQGRVPVVRQDAATHPWALIAKHRGAGIPAESVTNVEVVFSPRT